MVYGAVRLALATNASSLVRRARPVLERLAHQTGGTAFLEVPSPSGRGSGAGGNSSLVVIDEVKAASLVQVGLADMDIPLHCGSVGKLYLASLPADELEVYLGAALPAPTRYTVTDPAALRKQLDESRETGVAFNYQEHQEEWCGITAARDRAGRDLAYLNVTLPTYRWTEDGLPALAPAMRAAAAEIEQRCRIG